MKTIDILLSVYGQAPFLGRLLCSLRAQTYSQIRLLYRFDGEADLEALEALRGFPGGMEIPGREHLGVVCSYQKLLKASEADYVMFADQDDVWHDDKVGVTMSAMASAEAKAVAGCPVLVHSDLRVVDAQCQVISESFWRFQSLNPCRNSLRDLMIQNHVTGCAMMVNRPLAELAECPPEAICHDWYLAMVAAAFGVIEVIERPLIEYRQHGGNVYGAVPRQGIGEAIRHREHLRNRLVLTQRQAGAFLRQYGHRLSEGQRRDLQGWSRLADEPLYVKRLFAVVRFGFRKNDFLRTLGMLWAL